MSRVFLGMGSNIRPREQFFREALDRIRKWPRSRVVALSSIYESAFVGEGSQDDYLNACIELQSELDPWELLELGQGLESKAGRGPSTHQQPRTLDVDLLLHGSRSIDHPRLCLPHPRMKNRRFVLEALAELDPELRLSHNGASLRRMLSDPTIQSQRVDRIAGPEWWEIAL